VDGRPGPFPYVTCNVRSMGRRSRLDRAEVASCALREVRPSSAAVRWAILRVWR
jgi:hypothetical protein